MEATAYALLAHLHVDRLIDVLPIRNWLLSQMNGRGGYRSTQVIYDLINSNKQMTQKDYDCLTGHCSCFHGTCRVCIVFIRQY